MSELFPEHTIVIPKDEGIAFDPDETGTTFYENSIIKAKALFEIVGCPVIADDSGICVDALDGAPGIYSSRYAGPGNMTEELLIILLSIYHSDRFDSCIFASIFIQKI